MSVDTKVRLDGRVEPEEILNWIIKNIDSKAKMRPYKKDWYDANTIDSWNALIQEHYGDSPAYVIHTTIQLRHNNKLMYLHVHYTNINTYENLDYYTERGLEGMVKSETTQITASYSKESLDVAKNLVSAWGGWIDYDDCDGEPYVRINQGDVVPEKVRHVTLADVYEKFGEVVIID